MFFSEYKKSPIDFYYKTDNFMDKDYTGYNVEELLNDEYFIQWLLSPDVENEKFWNELQEKDPKLKLEIDKARSFVLHLQQDIKYPEFSAVDEIAVWNLIKAKTDRNKNRKQTYRIYRIMAGVAAILCLCFFIAREFYLRDKQDINYLAVIESVEHDNSHSKDVELILSDSKKIAISETESQVEYNRDGGINVNSKKVESVVTEEDHHQTFNQLIVPLGKRSSVTFSDGTKIWVNSGSKVIYPMAFDKRKREIFIEGEVYLDVTPDVNRPFFVKTRQMDVKVLGTSFNVSAYKNDPSLQVTLLEGKVEVNREGDQSDILLPNQQFDYDTQTNKATVKYVDVENYIAWKNGYYQFEKQPLNIVFKKLSRYYGIRIEWDEEVGKRICYGKLDLKDRLEDVLNNLKDATAIPMQFTHKDDYIKISMNP